MPSDYRETVIRWHGRETTVRTELTSTVKKMETAHTRAVKEAAIALKAEVNRDVYDMPADKAAELAKRYTIPAGNKYVDARKGYPRVKYNLTPEQVAERVGAENGASEYGWRYVAYEDKTACEGAPCSFVSPCVACEQWRRKVTDPAAYDMRWPAKQ